MAARLSFARLSFAGLIALPLGGQVLVMGATDIARLFGISEAVIGLTPARRATSLRVGRPVVRVFLSFLEVIRRLAKQKSRH